MKKIIKTTPYILFIISFIILIYTYYKSEIYWNSTKKDFYFTYYIISILLIFFSLALIFVNSKIREYLIIIFLSLILGCYLSEFILSFKLFNSQISPTKLIIFEEKNKKKYDKRSKFKIYKDLKKVDKKITISLSPSNYLNNNFKIFPLSGVSNSKTIHCNENGYFSIYNSDRFGFNNPDNQWENKNTEYVLIGDSFVHGACVNRPNDISSVLRDLSKKTVLNLGYDGTGPLIQYATLREYLKPNVENILWFYFEKNEFYNLSNEIVNKNLAKYIDNLNFSQNLKMRQNQIDKLAHRIINEEFQKKILSFLKLKYLRTQLNYYLPEKNKITTIKKTTQPEFKKILSLTKDLAKKNNSKLYFIYLPEYNRYVNKTTYNNYDYKLVKNIVNQLNINFIDIHKEVFLKEKNPLELFPFELEGHYTEEGYKKVTETIYNIIKIEK